VPLIYVLGKCSTKWGNVRATAVGWDTVLAGDLKWFRLLCNTNLNMNIPSRGCKEERIRIPRRYGLIAVLYPPQVIPYGMHMDYMEWVVESMERVMESMD